MSPLAPLFVVLALAAEPEVKLPGTPDELQQYLAGYWRHQLRGDDIKAQVIGDAWVDKALENDGKVVPPTEEELRKALATEAPKLLKLRQGYVERELQYYRGDGQRYELRRNQDDREPIVIYHKLRPTVKDDGYTYLMVNREGNRSWTYALYHGSIHVDLEDDGKVATDDELQYRILDQDHFQIVSVDKAVAQPDIIQTYERVADPPEWATRAVARQEEARELTAKLQGHWVIDPREEDVREELVTLAWKEKNYERFLDTDGVTRNRKKDWSDTGGKPVAPTEEEVQAMLDKRLEESWAYRQIDPEMEQLYFDGVGTLVDVGREERFEIEIDAQPYRVATEGKSLRPVEYDQFYLWRPKRDYEPRAELHILDDDHIQLRVTYEPEIGLPRWVRTYRRTEGFPEWMTEEREE